MPYSVDPDFHMWEPDRGTSKPRLGGTSKPSTGGGFWGDVAETWLGENPEAAYLGALQGWGTAPQRRRMQDQFSNIYGDFANRMYQQLLGGEVPEDDWLAQMRDPETVRGLIGQRYNRMTPGEKYGPQGRFTPQLSYRRWG